MPRPRKRTRLHVLADAIEELNQARVVLHEVDLRTTSQEVRIALKAARERVLDAIESTEVAYRASIVELDGHASASR